MYKKRIILVGGLLATAILLGAVAVSAKAPDLAGKRQQLEEKRAGFNRLVAEYRSYPPEQSYEGSVIGMKAKEMAPEIATLEREVEGISDEYLANSLRTSAVALSDGLGSQKAHGASPEYLGKIEARLREIERLQRDHQVHSRSNEEIMAEYTALSRSWR